MERDSNPSYRIDYRKEYAATLACKFNTGEISGDQLSFGDMVILMDYPEVWAEGKEFIEEVNTDAA